MATEKHDLLVIGGGPAGLTAALTAEAHGMDTLVLDNSNLGGQAASATLIENYPGFPNGISGDQLMSNIVDQALKFSTEFEAPSRVTHISKTEEGILATTEEGAQYLGNMALISTGLEQRLLRARNLAAYTHRGVMYGSPVRTTQYENKELFVVGGSDAAAQAAVHLSQFPGCNVHLIIRNSSLKKRASNHLIEKIATKSNIHIHANAEVTGVDGDGCLGQVTIKTGTDKTENLAADELFVLIGSEPRTTWLGQTVMRDRQGFILSGSSIPESARAKFVEQTNGRQPLSHETTMPGVFVAGDVRSGSGKWVTLAVFDGAAVIPELQSLAVHNRLH